MATQQQGRRHSVATEQLLKAHRNLMESIFKMMEFAMKQFPLVEDGIKKIQHKSGIENRYVIFSLACLPFMFLAAPVLLSVITMTYPLYMSVKAIEKGKGDRTRWLIYWLLYHALSFFELIFGFLLSWMAGFDLMKCAFLIWCMAPIESNGCLTTYRLLQPWIKRQILIADEYLGKMNEEMEKAFKEKEVLIHKKLADGTVRVLKVTMMEGGATRVVKMTSDILNEKTDTLKETSTATPENHSPPETTC